MHLRMHTYVYARACMHINSTTLSFHFPVCGSNLDGIGATMPRARAAISRNNRRKPLGLPRMRTPRSLAGTGETGLGGGGSICYRLLLSFCGFFFVLVICVITFLKMSVMAEIFLLLLVFGYSHHRTYASLIFTSLPLPGAHVRQAVRRLIPQR